MLDVIKTYKHRKQPWYQLDAVLITPDNFDALARWFGADVVFDNDDYVMEFPDPFSFGFIRGGVDTYAVRRPGLGVSFINKEVFESSYELVDDQQKLWED